MKKYFYTFTENILYGSTFIVFAKNETIAIKRFIKNYFDDPELTYELHGTKIIIDNREFFFSESRINHKMIEV